MARLRLAPDLAARRPDQVSGGELRRSALLRALLPGPRVIFADEPTSRLDPITQQEVMAHLQTALTETRAALLLVTHDPAVAARVAGGQGARPQSPSGSAVGSSSSAKPPATMPIATTGASGSSGAVCRCRR
jgi:alpha-D-ribose 1-methylphosphonate 5-triphosphate synthase subunit PhnL